MVRRSEICTMLYQLRGGKQAESLNQVLVTLNTLARALVAIEDPRQTLEEIARSAQQVLGADIVDLYQYDQAHNEFILPPIQVGKRRHNDLVITKVYPDDVSARVVKLGTPHYFPKSQEADMLTGKFETPRVGGPNQRFVFREEIISSAVLPLAAADEIVGIMFVNYRDPQAFSQEQRHLIESFANLAAIAIYNARLLKSEQRRRQQSEIFQEVSRLVNSTSVFEDIVDSLLLELDKLIDYDSASIQLFEGDRRVLVGGRGFLMGDAPRELRRNISEDPLISQIVENRKPIVLSDVNNEPLWDHIPQTAQVQSWMGVPFVFKDQVIGLLTLDHRDIGYYTQRSEDIAVTFANQVSFAIYNSKQTQALAELNKLMYQLIALEESPQGVHQLLEQIAQSALDVLKADIVDIYEYVERESRFELPRIRAGEVYVLSIAPNDINESGAVFQLIQRSTPLYEVNTLDNPVLSGDYLDERDLRFKERFAIREGIRSTAVVPLRSGDEAVGLMFASYRMPQAFTSEQRELIELFANQAAIAIQNARLYEQRVRDVQALQKISAAITSERWSESTDLSQILQLIVEEVMDVFDAASCAIRLYEPDTQQFADRVSVGLLKEEAIYNPRAGGTSEYLIDAKRPIFAENSTANIPGSDKPAIRKEFQEAGVASIAYLPLLSGEGVIGTLYVEWNVPRQFPENVKQVLRLFADQAVNAIKSAQLLQALAQRAALLERLQEVATAISAVTSDVGEVLHLIVGRINDVFPETSCEIRLYNPEKGKFTGERVAAGVLEEEVDYIPREGGTSTYVVEEQRPFYAGNITARLPDGTPAIRGRIASQGVQAVATLPLVSKGSVIGVLYVDWLEPHQFTNNDKQVLKLFADHAAIAINNAQMYGDLQQRQRDLALLNRASQALSSELDLEPLLKTILDQVRDLLGVVASSVWLVDAENEALICKQASGSRHEIVRGWQIGLGEGLVGLVAQEGESLIVGDVQTDERHFQDVDRATGLELHSILSVPLKFQEEVIGVLQVLDEAPDRFGTADLTLLESLGASAAIAIENAQLFQERENRILELAALGRISQELTSPQFLTIREMSRMLYEEAKDLMDLRNFYVASYDKERDLVKFEFAIEEDEEKEPGTGDFSPRTGGSGLTEYVVQAGKAIYIPANVDRWLEQHGLYDGLPERTPLPKCWLGVPIKVGNDVLGVIGVENQEHAHAYDEYARQVMSTIAAQIGVAIVRQELDRQNARLDEWAARLAQLQQVTAKISAKSSDPGEVLQSIADHLIDIFQGASCVIRLYDSVTDEFGEWVVAGMEKEQAGFSPRHEGTSRYIVNTKAPRYVEDASTPPLNGGPALREEILEQGIRAFANLPLLNQEKEVLGVLYVNLDFPHIFSLNDRQILELFADHAAISIENARLFEQIQKQREEQIEAIRRIGVNIAKVSDLDAILDDLLDDALYLMGIANLGEIRLYESDTDELVVRASRGQSLEGEFTRNKIGEGVTGWVAEHKEGRVVDDVTNLEPPEYLPFLGDTKSEIAVPMLSGDEPERKLIGVLNIESPEANAFSEDDLRLLEALAGQGVIAIENNRLYNRLQKLNRFDNRLAELERVL